MVVSRLSSLRQAGKERTARGQSRLRRVVCVGVTAGLMATACTSADPSDDGPPTTNPVAEASVDDGSLAGNGPTPPDRADLELGVEETAIALAERARSEAGVWSLLSNLGIGVYTGDGTQVLAGSENDVDDFWIYDFEGIPNRLTTIGNNGNPIWTPDGRQLIFTSDRHGVWNLFRKRVDGSAPAEQLTNETEHVYPNSLSPEGRRLVLTRGTKAGHGDLRILDLEGNGELQELIVTEDSEWGGVLSPNGQYLAYTSDVSGQLEVYVRPFPNWRE